MGAVELSWEVCRDSLQCERLSAKLGRDGIPSHVERALPAIDNARTIERIEVAGGRPQRPALADPQRLLDLAAAIAFIVRRDDRESEMPRRLRYSSSII